MAVEVCIRNSDHGLDGPSNYLGQVVRLVASYSVTMSEFTTVALISLREAKYLTQTNKQDRSACQSFQVNDILEPLRMMNQNSPSMVQ